MQQLPLGTTNKSRLGIATSCNTYTHIMYNTEVYMLRNDTSVFHSQARYNDTKAKRIRVKHRQPCHAVI